jgi:hypothetical protein
MNLNLTVLIVCFIGTTLYSFGQRNSEIKKIEFTTLTRGANEKVLITKDCVSVIKQGRDDVNENSVEMKLQKGDWQALLNSLQNISLADISSYQAPTNKRAYDGAWHSSITITTKDEKSYGHSFDNEEPNEKLQALMKTIRTLTERTKENKKR